MANVRRMFVRLAVMAVLPLTAGCAMQYSARSLGVAVTMAEPLGQTAPGDSFNITMHAVHYFWGLAPGRLPNLQRVLAGQLGTGGSVHSLTIRSRKKLSDLVFTAISLGLVSPTTVTFSGVVTRGTP